MTCLPGGRIRADTEGCVRRRFVCEALTMNWLTQRFDLSRAGSGSHVRPMEGLRGLAIFLVFLVHYVTLMEPWIVTQSTLRSIATALHTIGNTGVDLFFVLSGYLIYGSLITRPQRFGRFMARRIERIYPTFAVVFVIYVGLSFLLPAQSKIPAGFSSAAGYLVENFLLLPGLFPIQPMITVAWSLSYEMFYYLVIPAVIALLGLRERSAVFRALFFAAIAVATAVCCALYGGPVRLIMFISGILLFEAMNNSRLGSAPSSVAFAALAAGLLVMLLPFSGSAGYVLKVGVLFVTFFVLCHSCFSRPSAWLPRAFSWTPLRWLGNMSYSYYLIHGLALKAGVLALAVVVPPAPHGAGFFCAMMPLAFALTLLVSAALFMAVERPFSLSQKGTPRGNSPLQQHFAP